jgi:hypothetical protein
MSNLRRAVILLIAITTIASFTTAGEKPKANTLTEEQIRRGWKLLFDGKTLNGFKGATKDEVLNTCWKVENARIVCAERDRRPADLRGSIVTKDQYSSFDFRLDYKMDPNKAGHVNSGIKYFAYPNTELGLEYQLFDPDTEVRGKGALAALYDIFPVQEKPVPKPRGKWNTVRIVARGNHVEHWLNGKKVLEFERGSKEFLDAIAKSKFKNRDKFGQAKQGHILLQDHGGGIAFRNIRIRVLDD